MPNGTVAQRLEYNHALAKQQMEHQKLLDKAKQGKAPGVWDTLANIPENWGLASASENAYPSGGIMFFNPQYESLRAKQEKEIAEALKKAPKPKQSSWFGLGD